MDIGLLIVFLSNARSRCSYETLGEAGETTLPDGTKVIGPYTEGNLTYVDTYKGFDWFKGREEIRQGKTVLWLREYEGGITDNAHKDKESTRSLYGILKNALRQCPKDSPFRRGPKQTRIGDYEYSDECSGDMKSFRGKERITLNGKEVYILEYKGGLK
jgi:hypothetical protein